MSGDSPDPRPSPPPGDEAQDSPSSFGARLHTYITARAELLAIETREAAQVLGRKAVLAAGLAAAAFFAYALILVGVVSLLGRCLAALWPAAFEGTGWQIVAIVAGCAHLAAAALFVVMIRRGADPPFFEYTRSEFRKDNEWLQRNQSSKESGN